ncbi:MAG: hypothetical protein WD048_15805 [Chitinophagales bacterium]
MIETLLEYGMVFLTSMFKFALAPLAGIARDMSIVETALFTILGMMTTVLIVAGIKDEFRRKLIWKFKRNKALFTKRNRRIVTIWNKYGLAGVAFLTPVLFSPIVGVLVAVSFGGSKSKMVKYMFVSAAFWGFTLSILYKLVGNLIFVA